MGGGTATEAPPGSAALSRNITFRRHEGRRMGPGAQRWVGAGAPALDGQERSGSRLIPRKIANGLTIGNAFCIIWTEYGRRSSPVLDPAIKGRQLR